MSHQPTRILLIEDNPGDADMVRVRLENNLNVEVVCAERLSTGLAALQQKPTAAVLLDLNLPDSNGEHTFRNVLNKAPDVPVVVLSTLEDEALAMQAIHHGVQDYLVKGSFDGQQLARALRYAIERHAASALKTARDKAVAKGQYYTKASVKGGTAFTCSFCEFRVQTLVFDSHNGNRRTQAVTAMNQHVSQMHCDLSKQRRSLSAFGREETFRLSDRNGVLEPH